MYSSFKSWAWLQLWSFEGKPVFNQLVKIFLSKNVNTAEQTTRTDKIDMISLLTNKGYVSKSKVQ